MPLDRPFSDDTADEIEVRINDHVLVTYTKDPKRTWCGDRYEQDFDYEVWVVATLGDCTLQYFILGRKLQPMEHWLCMDIAFDLGRVVDGEETESLIYEDWDDVDKTLNTPGFESLHTWVRLARQKGGF